MGWITIGIVVIILLLLFLSLFFWSSGAVNIANEERSDIEHESPTEFEEDLKATEQQEVDEQKVEESEFYTRGSDE